MREDFDLTMSDDELEAHGRIFLAENLRPRMTFEQFITARVACARRRVRLDRADLEINPHRESAKSWARFWRTRTDER